MTYFELKNLKNNANNASSDFFGKMMKIMLVRPDYAKNYTRAIYSSLAVNIRSKSFTNASKIFRWRVTDAIYLPSGEYIKDS